MPPLLRLNVTRTRGSLHADIPVLTLTPVILRLILPARRHHGESPAAPRITGSLAPDLHTAPGAEPVGTPRDANGVGERELLTYRVVTGLAAVAVVAFGFVYRAV